MRTAVRQGAKSVKCVYRRDRENMPGSAKEVKHAIEEGVEFEFNTLPRRLVHDNGKLAGLEVVRTRLVEDAGGGRARPEEIPGSEEVLPASSVIFAFGFRPSPAEWLQGLGVETHDNGRIIAGESAAGQTRNAAIFAAGDNVRGADLVVTAIADAREAARGMIAYLQAQESIRKSA